MRDLHTHQSRAFCKCKHYNHRAGCPLYATTESGEDRGMSGRLGKGEERGRGGGREREAGEDREVEGKGR